MRTIGIDLGTTNTSIAWADDASREPDVLPIPQEPWGTNSPECPAPDKPAKRLFRG